jgi:hypothetical protein
MMAIPPSGGSPTPRSAPPPQGAQPNAGRARRLAKRYCPVSQRATSMHSHAPQSDDPRSKAVRTGLAARRAESAILRAHAAEVRPLRSRYVAGGVPTEAERGTAAGWRAWGGASVAATATLPEPASCRCGFCSGRQRQSAVTRGGAGASHLLGWSNGPVADIAMGHDLHCSRSGGRLGGVWGAIVPALLRNRRSAR